MVFDNYWISSILTRGVTAMTTIAHSGDYAIFKDEANVSPYAVFKWTGQFWQQITPWYYRKGNAINKYNKLRG